MRFCSIAAVYVMCFGVCAAPGYTLQQTKSFIHSAIQLKNPAKEVAETLHKMKLSEHPDLATVEGLQGPGAGPKTGAVLKVAETLHKMKLSEHPDLATVEGLQGPGAVPKPGAVLKVAEPLHKMKLSEHPDLATVEGLQGPGAGPKTGAVLKELATESAALQEAQPPAPKPVYVPPRPPSSEQQAMLLDEVRHYAVNYTHRLPDFICLEQTRGYVDAHGREAWRLVDVLTARLSYFNQKEDYKLVSKNGRMVTDVSYASVGGAFSDRKSVV